MKLLKPYPPKKGTWVVAIKPGSTFDGLVFQWSGTQGDKHAFNAGELRLATDSEVRKEPRQMYVWVCERKAVGGRTWRPESVQVHPPPRQRQNKSWEGVDGARYRMRKYFPKEP